MKRLTLSPSSSRRFAHGFTLLELMIALSIFSIMGLAAYRLLSGETRLQSELEAHSLELQQWQRGMRRLTDDLRQIAPRPIRLEYGDEEAALYGTSDSLHLTRYGWSNPLHKTRSQLQRIEYRLASEEENTEFGNDSSGQLLQRQVWAVLDRAPDSEPLQQRLLPQVSDLSWRYMDNDKQWHSQWPSSQPLLGQNSSPSSSDDKQSLPLAIEITLTSQRFGEITRLIVLRAFSEDTSS
jgi:general secretion pathway protein J